MNKLAASHLETRKNEVLKVWVMSSMGPETKKLFHILLPTGWDEWKTKLNPFMKRLMRDKGMSQACELVHSKMRC
jgi:hypothetical protein